MILRMIPNFELRPQARDINSVLMSILQVNIPFPGPGSGVRIELQSSVHSFHNVCAKL